MYFEFVTFVSHICSNHGHKLLPCPRQLAIHNTGFMGSTCSTYGKLREPAEPEISNRNTHVRATHDRH